MSDSLDLVALTRAAEAAARAGGDIVVAGFGDPANVREKSAGDWVSDVDTASERAVAALLAEAAPDIAFFGEETGGERAALGWICDPLDGTANFLHGFPAVGVSVALVDGSFHTVDSSDAAFQTAARIALVEGLPQCSPVLLEPIHTVEIVCPTDATAKINAIMSGRRGQILGFDTREGWDGWDVVRALMPESEIGDLIIEVRSATAGVGTFTAKFDHMAELSGKSAEQIVAARKAAAAAA